MLEKKELIKKFLLDGNPEEKRRKFEIAWDIWKTLPEILGEQSLVIFKKLKEKIEKTIALPYVVTQWDFGSLYVAKEYWKKDKRDRGIYSIGIEKWNQDYITIGLVKNAIFDVDVEKEIRNILSDKGLKSTKWFPGYLLISDWYPSHKIYCLKIMENPDEVIEKIFDYFLEIYKIITEDKHLKNLIDKAVEKVKNS